MAVTVVGAGVVGLTCAVALREAGFAVRVLTRSEPIVSDVAGGLWLPYTTGEDDRTLGWARATYERLEAEGATLVDYLHIERRAPAWLDALPPGRVSELAADRWVARVPLVEMPRHLGALRERAGGVRVEAVESLASAGNGLVVNCTGLAARWLAGDEDVVPVRGQVVHVRPRDGAAIPCVCDEDELTYVLPRPDVCVLGGTSTVGDDDLRVRDADTADIVARCTRLVPELEGASVVGARVGLRPLRRGGARVERVGDVIHCYGHGGAGLTLSWGCAAEVVALSRS